MPDTNPYQATSDPLQSLPPHPPVSAARRLVEIVVVLGIVLVLIGLLIPATRSARPAALRMQCSNNLKHLVLALQNYESDHGVLPPAFTTDAQGNRLHSWRTLLLPYVEQQQLYDQIDLTRAWNDPVNAFAMEEMPDLFYCPASERSSDARTTNYFAMFGPEACLLESGYRRLAEIDDPKSQTLAIWEGSDEQAIHWFSPHDPSPDTFLAEPIELHTGGSNVAFVDGSIRFLPSDMSQEQRRALITIAGGEELDESLW